MTFIESLPLLPAFLVVAVIAVGVAKDEKEDRALTTKLEETASSIEENIRSLREDRIKASHTLSEISTDVTTEAGLRRMYRESEAELQQKLETTNKTLSSTASRIEENNRLLRESRIGLEASAIGLKDTMAKLEASIERRKAKQSARKSPPANGL